MSQVDFRVALDSNQMLIGDQRKLQVTIHNPQSLQIDSIGFSRWSPVEWISDAKQINGSNQSLQQWLTFSIFDTGYFRLEPLPLYFQNEGNRDTVYANGLAIEVLAVPIDSTGLSPIKEIIREPIRFGDLLPYLGAIAAIMLLVFAYLYFQRNKKRVETEGVVIPIPPHEKALSALAALEREKQWQKGEIKLYQSQLTEVIRHYLEERYHIAAMESTSSEIIHEIIKLSVDTNLQKDLKEILNIADMVKFAKATPRVNVHQQFLEKARNFILLTKSESNTYVESDQPN